MRVNPNTENVGSNIKRFRKEQGITQKQLGEKLWVSQQTIAQFENDKAPRKLDTIKRIADALGVPVSCLIQTENRSAENVGSNIKRLRTQRGLTQSEFAALIDRRLSTVQKYESGAITPPIQAIDNIAQALNVSRYQILQCEDPKTIDALRTPDDEDILVENFRKLNSAGKKEALKRICELTELARYTEEVMI